MGLGTGVEAGPLAGLTSVDFVETAMDRLTLVGRLLLQVRFRSLLRFHGAVLTKFKALQLLNPVECLMVGE